MSVRLENEAGGGKRNVGDGKGGMLYAGRGAYDEPEESKRKGKEGEEWERYVRNDGIEDVRRKV